MADLYHCQGATLFFEGVAIATCTHRLEAQFIVTRLNKYETELAKARELAASCMRASEAKAEPKPEPRDPRACPTCGSLSTFNGACMKCHEDYANGVGG